jgi:hypothetical protein
MTVPLRLLVALFIFLNQWCGWVEARSVYIDDTFGDAETGAMPVFKPASGVWENATCGTCFVKPERTKAHHGTWTAATSKPSIDELSIEFSFTGMLSYFPNRHLLIIGIGTEVSIYFILANLVPGATTLTECHFTVDGATESPFQHKPDQDSKDILYDQRVFSKTGLANKKHDIKISTSGLNFGVFLNFDYAIYT